MIMAFTSSRKTKFDYDSVGDDEENAMDSMRSSKRSRFQDTYDENSLNASKRSYDDFMGDSDNESSQLTKKICHIDLSNSQAPHSFDDDDNDRNYSMNMGYSSVGYISKDMINGRTSALQPLELPPVNQLLHHLHQEKIARQHRDASHASSSTIVSRHADQYMSISPSRGSKYSERSDSPSSAARIQPYYQPLSTRTVDPHAQRVISLEAGSSYDMYDLQEDPQYQETLNRHRESYMSRLRFSQSGDNSMS
jgi:hypothetical protein